MLDSIFGGKTPPPPPPPKEMRRMGNDGETPIVRYTKGQRVRAGTDKVKKWAAEVLEDDGGPKIFIDMGDKMRTWVGRNFIEPTTPRVTKRPN